MAITITEDTYRAIRERALAGRLRPGSRLSEVALSKELGVSRTPIREAISRLVNEGLVEQIPNEGTFIKKPDRAGLEDLYQMREWVEGGALAEAVRFIESAQITVLEKACDESRSIARAVREAGEGNKAYVILQRCVNADLAFHKTLIQASGNRLAMNTVGKNHVLSRIWASMPTVSPDLHVQSWVYRDHARILRFVRLGDARRASEAMVMHIRRGCGQALRWFDLSQRREAAGLEPYTFWPELVLDTVRRFENGHEQQK